MGFWANWKAKKEAKATTDNQQINQKVTEMAAIEECQAKVANQIQPNNLSADSASAIEEYNEKHIAHLTEAPTESVDSVDHEAGYFDHGPVSTTDLNVLFNKMSHQKEKPKLSKSELRKQQKELKLKQKEQKKREKTEKAILKSSLTFSKDIKKLSKKYKEADDEFFIELEEVLIKTDMGMKMVMNISNSIQKRSKKTNSFHDIKELLVEELYKAYDIKHKGDTKLNYVDGRMNIFMVVGVNGTGKTTSLAKLSNYYAELDKKVMIVAGDTFRAGAIEQLEEWTTTRLEENIVLFKGKNNQDPSSVIFDAIKKAEAEKFDIVLIDTAGRIQNKVNLMKELEKMHNTIKKFDKSAPHEVLLVIDATTGQNGVIQAEEFSQVTKVSGIILTKMDGTSKGGIALAIKDELSIPVKMIGIGEQVDDLVEFDVEEYVYGLVAGFMDENLENDDFDE
ncbi:signal recognition particle-docking protein FtsY [Williamsoniiplasma luminosum]|uniref:signal recognition particle-docking protein FtsY n=1 Tax=Williamsoniiplasma luminosum TaxID=214888 RepID=UPI0026A16E1E|nr:signal recognition particle-docking protein FtsY [Williamsoniiplasma luminosum]